VEVIQNNGEPGAGAQILIRGGSSVSAKNDPLYVWTEFRSTTSRPSRTPTVDR